MILEILPNSLEKTCAREFCEIFKITFFYRTSPVAASESIILEVLIFCRDFMGCTTLFSFLYRPRTLSAWNTDCTYSGENFAASPFIVTKKSGGSHG